MSTLAGPAADTCRPGRQQRRTWAPLLLALLFVQHAACVDMPLPQQPPVAQGVYSPTQLGVHRLDLAGQLALKNGQNMTVTAHVLLKALEQPDGTLRLRVRVFFSDAQHVQMLHLSPDHVFPYHQNPRGMMLAQEAPSFFLRSSRYGKAGTTAWNLTHERLASPSMERMSMQPHDEANNVYLMWIHFWDNYVIPYHLNGEVPADGWTNEVYLCVHGWYQCCLVSLAALRSQGDVPFGGPLRHQGERRRRLQEGHLSVQLHTGKAEQQQQQQLDEEQQQEEQEQQQEQPQPPQQQQHSFVRVQHPFYDTSPSVAAYCLYVHTAYHVALGFSGTIVYDRGTYAADLLAVPELAALVANGSLGFVVWGHDSSGMPMPDLSAGRKEPFKHLIFDQQFVYNHAALAFWGRNTYLFFADNDDFLALAPGQMMQSLIAPGGCAEGASYVQMPRWAHRCNTSLEAHVQAINSTLDRFRSSNYRDFGLPHLTCGNRTIESLTGRYDHPKSLVLADAVGHFDIHFGWLRSEFNGTGVEAKAECASVRHLYNVLMKRDWVSWWGANFTWELGWHNFIVDEEWMGPFDSIRQHLQLKLR